jgi:hypothetical protein
MAFGQPSGPPASSRQVEELLRLLQGAGHTGFRDARGPMGFNQRQGGGRFTRDEAEELIERLQRAEQGAAEPVRPEPPTRPERPARPQRRSGPDPAIRRLTDDQLASELRRRGWTVTEPATEP